MTRSMLAAIFCVLVLSPSASAQCQHCQANQQPQPQVIYQPYIPVSPMPYVMPGYVVYPTRVGIFGWRRRWVAIPSAIPYPVR